MFAIVSAGIVDSASESVLVASGLDATSTAGTSGTFETSAASGTAAAVFSSMGGTIVSSCGGTEATGGVVEEA